MPKKVNCWEIRIERRYNTHTVRKLEREIRKRADRARVKKLGTLKPTALPVKL